MRNRNLTQVQEHILAVVTRSQRDKGFTPSYKEIGDEVGLASSSAVSYQLSQLAAKGYIHRYMGKSRAITVIKKEAN